MTHFHNKLLFGADDVGANRIQPTLNISITAIDLLDILDGANALGAHCGDEE